MPSIALLDASNRVINATKSDNPDVKPVIFDEGQTLLEFDSALFEDIMGKIYNPDTEEFEEYVNFQLVLQTAGPFTTGTTELVFAQQTLAGVAVTVPTTFVVATTTDRQEIFVDDGTLEVTITASEPTTQFIAISGPRHEPVIQEVVIGG